MPQSKDEAKKLVKRYKHGRLGTDSHAEAKTETIACELQYQCGCMFPM